MVMVTKKTHEVAQAYLRGWLTKNEEREGIWYFDLERQTIRFSIGKQPFSFAAENYLYVPAIDGKRNQDAERWLSSGEGALKAMIDRIRRNDMKRGISGKELTGFLMGATSFAYRSGYEIKLMLKQLQTDAVLRGRLLEANADVHVAVVENMINVITMRVQDFLRAKKDILLNVHEPLLVCDRPMLDMAMRHHDFAVMPLGPHDLLRLDATADDPNSIGFHAFDSSEPSDKIAATVNHMTVERARKWIVATSEKQLAGLRDSCTIEALENRKKTDRLVFTPTDGLELRRWWKLRR